MKHISCQCLLLCKQSHACSDMQKIPAHPCKKSLHPYKKAGVRFPAIRANISHTCNFGHEVPVASHLSQIIAVFTQTDRKSAGPSARPRNSHVMQCALIMI